MNWLAWARRISAIAQNGLTYTENPFDIERYQQLQKLAKEIIDCGSDIDDEQLKQVFEESRGYATPKVDVRGAVFRDNRILLVKEISDGCWTLPGGWADVNDSPAEAVCREIREESGYEAEAVKLAAVYDRDKHDHPPDLFHIYKLFFVCRLTGGSAATSIETSEVDFFSFDNLPQLSRPRVNANQIRTLFHHYHHPDIPTEFD